VATVPDIFVLPVYKIIRVTDSFAGGSELMFVNHAVMY
jgi:hypothetical protein